jgi:hypothetical protein
LEHVLQASRFITNKHWNIPEPTCHHQVINFDRVIDYYPLT